jgi:hypothetical protein
VLVNGGRVAVVRQRQSIKDLLKDESIASWLK